MFPLNVPGTANVAAIKLVTLFVHVPDTVIVPERLMVESPEPTPVTVAAAPTVRLAPVKLMFAGMCLLVLIVHVVANVPESHKESKVKNTNAKVPWAPGTALPATDPPATEYSRFRL